MGPSPSYVGGTRFCNDRDNQSRRHRCHAAGYAVLCLILFLASCASPPPQIVIAECSAGSASIVLPIDDRSQVDPYGKFSWSSDPGVSSYLLTVGTEAGQTDVWTGTIDSGTSAKIPGLQPFTTYYLQLVAQTGPGCTVTKMSFSTGAGLAHLNTPGDGKADVDPAVVFTWNGVVDAEMFKIQLSTVAAGENDEYDSGQLPNITSLAHPDLLPNTQNYNRNGSLQSPVLKPNTTYFARMVTRKRGTDFFVDSTFTTGFGTAHLLHPGNEVGGIGPHPIFTWNAVGDAEGDRPYKLDLGSAPGLDDVGSTGWISETEAPMGRASLAPEKAYYARIWTQKRANATYSDSAFSTGPFDNSKPVAARILYPLDNQTDVDPLKPIVWSAVANARYIMLVGTGTERGVSDRNAAWNPITTHTSWAGGLTGGSEYYVTLTTFSTSPSPCSVAAPCQTAQRIKFTAGSTPKRHSAEAFNATVAAATATIRNMANAGDVPFSQTFLFDNWDNQTGIAVCADFANNLTDQLQNVGIVARRRDSIFGLGPLQHSVVGYRNPMRKAWEVADATFGMVFSTPSDSIAGMSVFEIAQTLDHGNVSSIPVRFVTTESVTQGCPECFGDYWAKNFSVDPMILYLNPTSYEIGPAVRHDPSKFLVEYSGPAGIGGTYIFRFQSLSDSVVVQDGGSQYLLTPTSPVASGRNFSQQLRPGDGWFYATLPPPGMEVYKLACPFFDNVSCR